MANGTNIFQMLPVSIATGNFLSQDFYTDGPTSITFSHVYSFHYSRIVNLQITVTFQ